MAVSGSAKMCFGALMTSAIFILQASSIFFPVLGAFLSAACTMFAAAGAVMLKRHAVIIYLGAGLLILAISPRYAAEFLMTTGFVGLSLGLLMKKNPVFSLLVSSIGMFTGLCSITYLLGSTALGGLFASLPGAACLPVYAVFSIIYSVLWFYVLKKFLRKAIFKYRYQY